MKETIELSQETYLSLLRTLEKAIYIIHRCESREDCDNNAYSLAICFAKFGLAKEFLAVRSSLYQALSEAEFDELDDAGFFALGELEDYTIPYEDTLEELREKLSPYLPVCRTHSEYQEES